MACGELQQTPTDITGRRVPESTLGALVGVCEIAWLRASGRR